MNTEATSIGPGHWRLYLIVSVSGAAILSVELLGTRVLGPFYGVSLFLWSALISVTLAALSAGYAIGGAWADRSASYSSLGTMLGSAGIWLLAVPWMRGFVLRLTEPMGLRVAVLVAATILFFPPLGIFVGALAGAVIGEWLAMKQAGAALRAGWGVFVGTLFGVVLKLAASGVITYYFVAALVQG